MYLDVITALNESIAAGKAPFKSMPRVIGGRYGLSSKEFTPTMVKAVYDELKKSQPKNHFTVGINDDVSHTSLSYDPNFSVEKDDVVRAIFYGLGADGTSGVPIKTRSRLLVKIPRIMHKDYFVYDSKKSGSTTTSHLRFWSRPIHSIYLIDHASFVACHQWFLPLKSSMCCKPQIQAVLSCWTVFMERMKSESLAASYPETAYRQEDEIVCHWRLRCCQENRYGKFVLIQLCKLASLLSLAFYRRMRQLKPLSIPFKKRTVRKGEAVVQKNYEAVDQTLANLFEVKIPSSVTGTIEMPPVVSDKAPDFVKNVLAPIIAGNGEQLPVQQCRSMVRSRQRLHNGRNGTLHSNSCMGNGYPVFNATNALWFVRIAAIRTKVYDPAKLSSAPAKYKSDGLQRTRVQRHEIYVQVAPEDCTGCTLCVEVCPAKSKQESKSWKLITMKPQPQIREQEKVNYEFFLGLPEGLSRA